MLTTDLAGHALAAPVLYPGSIERTSIAEAGEEKGFLHLTVSRKRLDWRFERLPARPLVRCDIDAGAMTDDALESGIRSFIAAAPADAVLTIRASGTLSARAARFLSAANLRGLAPDTMNVEVRAEAWSAGARPDRRGSGMLELPL